MAPVEPIGNNRDEFLWDQCDAKELSLAEEIYGATAWLNYDGIDVVVDDFLVRFSLSDILGQGIADMDTDNPIDQGQMIADLLPILKGAVEELERRQAALKANYE